MIKIPQQVSELGTLSPSEINFVDKSFQAW